ncbi:hypothetical protein CLF_110410 [Clonorchis sinensis]|uniref:Integrase catalytic domain-containing protein n=1 Tax=Clonorchis sinensis TaxID=79923 RepID=G7YKN8_CLOSI|nr:hypothetical protein CLF_110410 [Clonorchis sinensis]
MDDKKLTAYFLHFVSKEVYTLIKNLVYSESTIDISYNALKKKVLQHFKPINFVAAERDSLNMFMRSHSLSFRDSLSQLQTQAAKCDYGTQLEDRLRDRLIAGIQFLEIVILSQRFKNLENVNCVDKIIPDSHALTGQRNVISAGKRDAFNLSQYPWPFTCETFQRVHADYCGPSLDKYYVLIVIDTYPRLPEVFPATSPRAEFRQQASRKVFSHESVPTALVTDNDTHFTAKSLEEWLKRLGCRHLFTAPRYFQSNGLAENFVRTLKSTITSFSPTSFMELNRVIDNFLMQYRNAVHSATGKSPAFLFKSSSLRTSSDCAQTAYVALFKSDDLRPAIGIILSSTGKRMVTIPDLDAFDEFLAYLTNQGANESVFSSKHRRRTDFVAQLSSMLSQGLSFMVVGCSSIDIAKIGLSNLTQVHQFCNNTPHPNNILVLTGGSSDSSHRIEYGSRNTDIMTPCLGPWTVYEHLGCGRNGYPSNVRRGMQCRTRKAWWHFNCASSQDDQRAEANDCDSGRQFLLNNRRPLEFQRQRCSGGGKPHVDGTFKVRRAARAPFRNRRKRCSSELHIQVTTELDWVRLAESSGKPTGKQTTRADVDIGECCKNRTTTEAVKLPSSSSTASKVASLIVDTVVAKVPDSQGLKPNPGEPETPSCTQLATLIAGDSDNHTSAKESAQETKQTQICFNSLNNSQSGRRKGVIERATRKNTSSAKGKSPAQTGLPQGEKKPANEKQPTKPPIEGADKYASEVPSEPSTQTRRAAIKSANLPGYTTLGSSPSEAAETVLKCLSTNCLSLFNKLCDIKQSVCLDYTIRQIRKLLAGFKVQSSEKTSLMGAPPKELLGKNTSSAKGKSPAQTGLPQGEKNPANEKQPTKPPIEGADKYASEVPSEPSTQTRRAAIKSANLPGYTTLGSSPSEAAETVLKCLSTNCLSLFNKLCDIKQSVCLEQPSIIALTETWLTPDVSDAEISIDGYSIFRADSKRGRVAPLHLFTMHGSDCFHLGVVYRSPSSSPEDDQFLIRTLGQLFSSYHFIHLRLVGDFNAPKAPWTELQCVGSSGIRVAVLVNESQRENGMQLKGRVSAVVSLALLATGGAEGADTVWEELTDVQGLVTTGKTDQEWMLISMYRPFQCKNPRLNIVTQKMKIRSKHKAFQSDNWQSTDSDVCFCGRNGLEKDISGYRTVRSVLQRMERRNQVLICSTTDRIPIKRTKSVILAAFKILDKRVSRHHGMGKRTINNDAISRNRKDSTKQRGFMEATANIHQTVYKRTDTGSLSLGVGRMERYLRRKQPIRWRGIYCLSGRMPCDRLTECKNETQLLPPMMVACIAIRRQFIHAEQKSTHTDLSCPHNTSPI